MTAEIYPVPPAPDARAASFADQINELRRQWSVAGRLILPISTRAAPGTPGRPFRFAVPQKVLDAATKAGDTRAAGEVLFSE